MDDQKRKEADERLDAMFDEEVRAMKAKGATEADLREEVCRDMIRRRVLERHAKELDPEIWAFLAEEALENYSPKSLRELAAAVREDGHFDTAYDIETLADLCERGEWCL